MEGIALMIAFIILVAVMIYAISKLKLHPFLAILLTALVLAFISGISPSDIPGVIGAGFSGIFASIGIVILLGGLIGFILEKTGGAFKIANMVINLVGKASPSLAMVLMGWVVSIPVFCDSGFVIMNPVRRSIVKRSGTSGVSTSLGLGGGLYISHVLVPPTPGPIAAANELGLADNLVLVIGVGALISIPIIIVTYLYAEFCGKRTKSAEDHELAKDATVKSYEDIVKEYGTMPSGFLSLAPVLVPIIAMTFGTVGAFLGWEGNLRQFSNFTGNAVIALALGTICAVVLLAKSKKISDFNTLTNDTLKTMGPILFITGSGGALGQVIRSSGLVDFVAANADALIGLGVFFPFLIAAVLKTAQGSSTVAIVTTASIMAPLMGILGFTTNFAAALVVMAIGAGSMMASHANDSYFWVVTRLSDMTPEQGYKNWTSMTVVQGLTAIIAIFVASLFI
ncbi:MAG: GntP family permease [Defluviitaleaceae bacterium]|nr:GntP family permease [Defluviitaleaceae bacterium]